MKNITLLFIFVVSVLSRPVFAETIFSDNFQDGDIGDWTIAGVGPVAIANLYNSNYSIRLLNRKTATRTISTSGYDSVSVTAKVVGDLLETGDSCLAELSLDNGSNWDLIRSVVNGQDNGVTWYSGTISPAAASDQAGLLLRMRANGSDGADYCFFDDIVISGNEIDSGSGAPIPFSDDFDTGWEGWTGDNGNATAGVGVSEETGLYIWSGNAVKFRGSANITKSFSTVGEYDITLDWHLLGGWLEFGESCDVQVNTGAGFNTVATLINGEDDWYYRSGSIVLDGAADNNPNVQVRLRGSANNEYNNTDYDVCYADEFSLYSLNPEPEIAVTGSGAFGSLEIGGSSTQSIVVSNEGSANLNVGLISGADDQAFSIVADTCSNQTITASDACSISVQFFPTQITVFSDSLSIPSNDSDEAVSIVTLTGEGIDSSGGNDDYDPLTGDGNVSRTLVTHSILNGSSFDLVDYSGFAVPANGANPSNTFQGRLTLSGEASTGTLIERGTNLRGSYTRPENLPEFDYDLIQIGTHIFPVDRGLTITNHPSWQYVLEPGRVWNESGDQGFSRVALPFALQEAGANCTHNGVMSFLFKDDGSISNLVYQIAGETCQYFKYDSWGSLSASYTPASVSDAPVLISEYQDEVARRMPTKPIAELATDYPASDIDIAMIGSDQSSAHQTLFGVAVDGINYVGGCATRRGDYPFCDVMAVPSYSTSKSIFGAVGLMRLEKKYPGAQQQNTVSLCSDISWSQVTWGNLLDMATGRYSSAAFEADEGDNTTLNNFFLQFTHSEKLAHSCSYGQIAAPDSTWVYHTSDTYLLGSEMNNFDSSVDIWDMLNDELWKPLGLSPVITTTLRTNDFVLQPYTGYGLTFHRDDVVKIAEFLNKAEGELNGVQMLDETMMAETLQKTGYHGLYAGSQYDTYDNGFWIWKADEALSCNAPLYIPYMSGFGGIVVGLLPNDMIFYAFSDNNDYAMTNSAKELNKIRSMCN